MGHRKGVNLSAITLCLLYDFARTGNGQSLEAARRIVQWRQSSAPTRAAESAFQRAGDWSHPLGAQ